MASIHGKAAEIIRICHQGFYETEGGVRVEIADEQAAAVAGVRLFRPAELEALREQAPRARGTTMVEVVDATTQEAAHRFVDEAEVSCRSLMLLNFASARNPGGGFLGGAKAQEEDLCRCSGLYPTLLEAPDYYATNRKQTSLLYSDHLIYSPQVPFFRVRGKAPFLAAPFLANVITAPAPNAGAIQQNQPTLVAPIPETFARRWRNVLAAAESMGDQTLILGAWGAGAFRNDPRVVAETAKAAIESERFRGVFRRIVFAVPSFSKISERNLAVFAEVFD